MEANGNRIRLRDAAACFQSSITSRKSPARDQDKRIHLLTADLRLSSVSRLFAVRVLMFARPSPSALTSLSLVSEVREHERVNFIAFLIAFASICNALSEYTKSTIALHKYTLISFLSHFDLFFSFFRLLSFLCLSSPRSPPINNIHGLGFVFANRFSIFARKEQPLRQFTKNLTVESSISISKPAQNALNAPSNRIEW